MWDQPQMSRGDAGEQKGVSPEAADLIRLSLLDCTPPPLAPWWPCSPGLESWYRPAALREKRRLTLPAPLPGVHLRTAAEECGVAVGG